MSHCELILFKDGKPDGAIAFQNANGGVARIRDAIWAKYMLSELDRIVYSFTTKRAYVANNNFLRFAGDLREFVKTHPAGDCVDHLSEWASYFEDLHLKDWDAIGLNPHSGGDNPWEVVVHEDGTTVGVPLSEGWEIYGDDVEK